MSITFAYPTIAAPTTTVVLGDIEGFPHSRPWRLFQSAFDTDAATQVIYDHGDPYQAVPLTLFPLTTAEVSSLVVFLKKTVNGRAKEWQLKDTAGDIYNVKFAQDVIDPIQINHGIWTINIVLRVVDRSSRFVLNLPLQSNLDVLAGVGSVDFTRSNMATYIDPSDGVLKTALSNVPRFEARGILIENSASNYALQSENFALWGGTAVVSANTVIAPDSNQTADTVEDNSSVVNQQINATITIADDAEIRTFSLFLKKDTAAKTQISIALYGGTQVNADVVLTWADLSTLDSGAKTQSYVTELSDGWVRLEVSCANNSTGNTSALIYLWPSAWVAGGTTTGTVHAWGAQFEINEFATSYIPTTTSSVFRGDDNLTIQFNGNHPSIQAGNPLTVVVSASTRNVNAAERTILTAGHGEPGVDEFSVLLVKNNFTDVAYYRSNTAVDFTNVNLGNHDRYAITVDSLQLCTPYINGNVEGIPATHNLATNAGVDAVNIGIGCRADGSNQLNGHVSAVKIYSESLVQLEIDEA